MTEPRWSQIARKAIPIKADCYNCNWTCSGTDSRVHAEAHREVTGHATWVECAPAGEKIDGA